MLGACNAGATGLIGGGSMETVPDVKPWEPRTRWYQGIHLPKEDRLHGWSSSFFPAPEARRRGHASNLNFGGDGQFNRMWLACLMAPDGFGMKQKPSIPAILPFCMTMSTKHDRHAMIG